MRRRSVFAGVFLLAREGLRANPANGDPRLERLFQTFISPCCWRENLLNHQSQTAAEVRTEIMRLVAAGKSDEEIKATMVARYSKRILSMPEGGAGHWLSLTPIAATLAALAFVTVIIRRSVASRPTLSPRAATLPDLPDTEWP